MNLYLCQPSELSKDFTGAHNFGFYTQETLRAWNLHDTFFLYGTRPCC